VRAVHGLDRGEIGLGVTAEVRVQPSGDRAQLGPMAAVGV
jgi:hypothetical protein